MVTIEDVIKLVALQLGHRSVTAESRIVEDLGAESSDIVNILAVVEERYGVFIEEAEIARILTVNDLFQAVRGGQ